MSEAKKKKNHCFFIDAEEVRGSSPLPPTIIEEKRVPVLPEPFFYGITFVKIKFRVEETT